MISIISMYVCEDRLKTNFHKNYAVKLFELLSKMLSETKCLSLIGIFFSIDWFVCNTDFGMEALRMVDVWLRGVGRQLSAAVYGLYFSGRMYPVAVNE